MPKRKVKPISEQVSLQVAAMHKAARLRLLADLRDGRVQRSVQVPSGKAYKRRPRTFRDDE